MAKNAGRALSGRIPLNKLIIYTKNDQIIYAIDGYLNDQFYLPKIGIPITTLLKGQITKKEINTIFKLMDHNTGFVLSLNSYDLSISRCRVSDINHYTFILEPRVHKNSSEILGKEHLANIIRYAPGFTYLKDTNFCYVLCNENFATVAGLSSSEEIIGKTDYDLVWAESQADLFRQGDIEALSGIKKINFEEPQLQADGSTRIVLANKIPLYDSAHKVVGILGNYLDISDQKKIEEELNQSKENLESAIAAKIKAEEEERKITTENATHKAELEAQEQFTKMANQVAHDIRSPLASLLMIVKACEEIPERERIALRAASTRISDIANNLLHQYQVGKSDSSFETEEKRPILLSATLLQLLTEKKFQYQDCSVKLDCQFDQTGQFAFISIEPSSFERTMSNLINNAVDAFSGKPGVVTLKIDATTEWSNVIVADNGKGISPALIEKIMNNIAVTEGKVDGNGIGLTQVRETLARNNGTLSIHSKIGQGTEIKLKFPRVKAPSWIAEDITFGKQGIVVILDDDHSIHGAWDSRFELILKQAPEIKLHHFETGQEALTFLKTLAPDEKKRTILLTDFELLKQDMNGLDVVERANLSRSILVTSHYDNPDIQKRAYTLDAKILPKQLASEIPMNLLDEKHSVLRQVGHENRKSNEFVHAIIVDDDIEYVENNMRYTFDDSDVIVHFTSPEELKKNLAKYPEKYLKDTKVCLDNNFENSPVKGIQLAEELHDMGYTQLYLISGDTFHSGELPKYLTALGKGELIKIKDW